MFLEENLDTSKITEFSFASRKEPEYMCHRLMRCMTCDVVYVSNPPPQDELAQAYHAADYDSSEEATDAADAYMEAMRPVLAKLAVKERVLEIGAGNGVLLERLKDAGFRDLVGIEPSPAAIAAAPAHRRGWLREGIFVEEAFDPASFDLICCFMTMEHVRDPMATAQAARRLLRPGGVFITVTHDYTSLVNRLLGRKSPIIDIEHMQIFSQASIRELFRRSGYEDISSNPFYNRYALRYWVRLAPLPRPIKNVIHAIGRRSGVDGLRLSVNVGNTITSGFRRR